MENKSKGLAIASLVLGIIALVLCWIPVVNFVSFILGILAIIFGIIAIVKKAGLGLGVAGLILAIISMILAHNTNVAATKALGEALEDWATSYSGEWTITTESGETTTSDWLSSIISEGVDELNGQIQTGVEELGEGVNQINEGLQEGLQEGVDTINEGLEAAFSGEAE